MGHSKGASLEDWKRRSGGWASISTGRNVHPPDCVKPAVSRSQMCFINGRRQFPIAAQCIR
jgi:hypothetical protein